MLPRPPSSGPPPPRSPGSSSHPPRDGGRADERDSVGEPPAVEPWDQPIADAAFALLDLEMTGLDVERDRVIEICLERRRGGRVEDRLETLVDPGPDAIFGTDVHGIAKEELAGAPRF